MTRFSILLSALMGLLLAACQGGGGGGSTTMGTATGSAGSAVTSGSGSGATTGGQATTSAGTPTSSSGTTTGQLQGYVDTLAGGSYGSNCKDGDAGYFAPLQVAIGPSGSVYVTDEGPLFQIAADGGITVILDTVEAQVLNGDGAVGIAVSPSGSIFLSGGSQVYRLIGTSLSLFAGDGSGACYDSNGGVDGGVGFLDATALTADALGDVFVADNGLGQGSSSPLGCTRIQKVTPNGTITTVAGNGLSGFIDGSPDEAEFFGPSAIAVDQAGVLYVADTFNNRVRKVAPDGTTSTLAGNGNPGFDDGTGGPTGTATFNAPVGVALDSAGIVYVSDGLNNSIRQIAPDGTTTTLAGNGVEGYFDGTLGRNGTTELNRPQGIAVDPQGSTIYVADDSNCRVRVIHITR